MSRTGVWGVPLGKVGDVYRPALIMLIGLQITEIALSYVVQDKMPIFNF